VRLRGLLALALLAALAACGTTSEVVLLPNPDGHASTLTIGNAAGSAVLDTPGAAASVSGAASVPERVTLSDAAVKRDWADAIAFQPPRPVTLRLYFILDTTELTPQSRAALPQVLQLIRQRPAPEVEIVGNTDRSGEPLYNQGLGLRRAEAVRRAVEAIGVPPNLITVASHGAGDPLVPTTRPYEPRNRRVDITVR